LWGLDACVKAGVLVNFVCLMTTLKVCVRHFGKVPRQRLSSVPDDQLFRASNVILTTVWWWQKLGRD
jgi:hypothetical protein